MRSLRTVLRARVAPLSQRPLSFALRSFSTDADGGDRARTPSQKEPQRHSFDWDGVYEQHGLKPQSGKQQKAIEHPEAPQRAFVPDEAPLTSSDDVADNIYVSEDEGHFSQVSSQREYVPPEPRRRERVVNEHDLSAWAIGRRKTAVARVRIVPGDGGITVNGRDLVDYFPLYASRDKIVQPLMLTETVGRFDVSAKVVGGGFSGQAGAVSLGVARALQRWDPGWRFVLKRAGLLTRDPRMVERKKPGGKGARKKKQWSKR